MADKKVTQLTALTAPANTDLLLIIDDPAGSPVSKKITVEDLFGATSTLTVDSVDVTATNGVTFTGTDIALTSTNRVTSDAGIVINNGSNNSDTVIKSENNPNMVYVDASADAVGIGTNAPTEALDINSDAIRIRTGQTPANSSVGWAQGTISWDSSYLYIAVNGTTVKRVALSSF